MDTREKTVIALGSGGFTHEPDNPLLDLYILSQSLSDNPRTAFLPTANSNPAKYIEDFYRAFSNYRCTPSHLDLFHPHTNDLEDYLLSQDVIYVGGGNTKSMMAVWREWGVDDILKKAWDQGVVLAGVSAGAICWFDEGVTASIPNRITHIKGLGLIKGSCCPHYDASRERQNALHQRMASGDIAQGYAIDDHAAIHFTGNDVKFAVSSQPQKKVSLLKGDQICALEVHLLSLGSSMQKDTAHKPAPSP